HFCSPSPEGLACGQAYSTSGLRARSTAGRQSRLTRAAAEPQLWLGGGDQPFFDGGLAGLLACSDWPTGPSGYRCPSRSSISARTAAIVFSRSAILRMMAV